ncbi:MAG: hypothetical protein LIP12_13120 [Clostridiales bacterium]|nr:hypothetical protein [Clostridiales bacterium]
MPDYNDEYMYENAPHRNKNPMSTAALTLGILSITCCSIIYISLPFGAIAVICAILSRGNGQMPGRSKAGIICGIAGLIATVVVTVSSFYYVLTTEEGRNYLQYYYRVYSGDYDFDLDDALGEMFPFFYGSGNDTDGSDDAGSGSEDNVSQEYGGYENELPGDDSENDGSGSGGSGGDHSGGSNGSDHSSGQDDGRFI